MECIQQKLNQPAEKGVPDNNCDCSQNTERNELRRFRQAKPSCPHRKPDEHKGDKNRPMQQRNKIVVEFIGRPAYDLRDNSRNQEIGQLAKKNETDRDSCGLQINVRAHELNPGLNLIDCVLQQAAIALSQIRIYCGKLCWSMLPSSGSGMP